MGWVRPCVVVGTGGGSQASVAPARESVSKAVVLLTFHGVASYIPGVLSLRKIVDLILIICSYSDLAGISIECC